MQDRIIRGLEAQFEKHRIVFWYDPGHEFRPAFEALAPDGVEKIEVTNTEFAVKHRVLREEPKRRFLLYRDGPRPADIDNWLLDIELAHGVFKSDQVAIWLADLGLPISFEAGCGQLGSELGDFFLALGKRTFGNGTENAWRIAA